MAQTRSRSHHVHMLAQYACTKPVHVRVCVRSYLTHSRQFPQSSPTVQVHSPAFTPSHKIQRTRLPKLHSQVLPISVLAWSPGPVDGLSRSSKCREEAKGSSQHLLLLDDPSRELEEQATSAHHRPCAIEGAQARLCCIYIAFPASVLCVCTQTAA